MTVAASPTPHRFTVDEYYRLAELGFFRPDARLELIEGEILDMNPIGSPHAACVSRLNRLFSTQVGNDSIVLVQNPVRLSDISEPEPDLALLAFRDDYYSSGHPGPAEVYLLVEVADSSLRFDRDVKGPLYALHGVTEYWIVDLSSACVLVHTEPSGDGYATVWTAQRGDVLVPRFTADVTVAVADVLGTH